MENRNVSELIEELKILLDCSQRVVYNLVGLTEESAASELGKKRVKSLLLVASHLSGKGASPSATKSSLEKHVYGDLDGNKDSVRSAIYQDKYPDYVLIKISDIAYEKYLEHQTKGKI